MTELAKLSEDVIDIKKSLLKIEQGLFGDDKIGHDGVIKQLHNYKVISEAIKKDVEDAKTQKEQDLKLFNNNKWWITGIASSIGAGISMVIHHFVNK